MKCRLPLLLFTALLASLPPSARAAGAAALQSTVADGPVKMTAIIDKGTARVAEPVQLVLEVEAPRGTRIELPAKADHLGDFEVRRSERTSDIPSAKGADKRAWIMRATLESIKTGDLSIPSLEIHYTTDADVTALKGLSTKPIQVRITSVLENRADPTKFRDIKQTIDVPVPPSSSRSWLAWVGGGVLVAAAALFLIAAVRKHRRRGPSPAAWALASLEELQQLDVLRTGPETLFNEVVEIIREYVELEFNVPTLRRTTREFLAAASGEVGLPDIASKRLEWLASVADEIKFARLSVNEQHLEHAFAQAKAFVAECEAFRRSETKGAA